jgi:hypothetical protein
MPDIDDEFRYLIQWIQQIGFCESNGMGVTVISYVAIQAWANLMQENPSPHDVEVLRSMSSAFISMQDKAKVVTFPDPMKELNQTL